MAATDQDHRSQSRNRLGSFINSYPDSLLCSFMRSQLAGLDVDLEDIAERVSDEPFRHYGMLPQCAIEREARVASDSGDPLGSLTGCTW
jgi:hypothetical protein